MNIPGRIKEQILIAAKGSTELDGSFDSFMSGAEYGYELAQEYIEFYKDSHHQCIEANRGLVEEIMISDALKETAEKNLAYSEEENIRLTKLNDIVIAENLILKSAAREASAYRYVDDIDGEAAWICFKALKRVES